MTLAIAYTLLAIFLTVALGHVAGRLRWLGSEGQDPARVLGNAAFYVFVPALLFRTTVRLDFATMPWNTVAAFFVPTLCLLGGVYAWQRTAGASSEPAAAACRAISATFGNTVQVGTPLAAALFGELGLGIHIALVSLHALQLLTVLTALAELDLARARRGAGGTAAPPLLQTLATTLRNTLIHPVVLPVVVGLLWNATGLGLHPIADEALATLGAAVVPVCLVLIGMTLAYDGLPDRASSALWLSAVKLLLLPALVLVLVVARWGFGLAGQSLQVVVVMAALPTGSNALIFAQRYGALQTEAAATIVFSTLCFALSLSFWLAVLALL